MDKERASRPGPKSKTQSLTAEGNREDKKRDSPKENVVSSSRKRSTDSSSSAGSKDSDNLFVKDRRINQSDVLTMQRSGNFDSYIVFEFDGATKGTPFLYIDKHYVQNEPDMKMIRKEGMTAATR